MKISFNFFNWFTHNVALYNPQSNRSEGKEAAGNGNHSESNGLHSDTGERGKIICIFFPP